MNKKIGLMAAAILFLASAVSAQEAGKQKVPMLVGGELGFGFAGLGVSKFSYEDSSGQKLMDDYAPFVYNAFDITPVFQAFAFRNESTGVEIGLEAGARLAFGSNGYGTTFAFSPDVLLIEYYTKVPYVTPFTGVGIGMDLTAFPYPQKYNVNTLKFENKTNVNFRFAIVFKAGLAYNIPNTKLQVYLADKFRLNIPFGIVNDINVGLLYKL